MHDRISKFSQEFNVVYMQSIEKENNLFNIPYCLSKMKSGVDVYALGKKAFIQALLAVTVF